MLTGSQYINDLGQSEIFYGMVVALFPLGRMVGSLPVGFWSDNSGFRKPMLFANFMGVIGGCLYGLASYFGSPSLCLAGRILGGIGATHPLSAWAARGYPPERRAEIESFQKSMNNLGIIFGPWLNAFFAKSDLKAGPFILNPETAAGYCPALLSLIVLIGMFIYLEEPPPVQKSETVVAENPFKVLVTSGIWVCLLLVIARNMQLSSITMILTGLNSQVLDWGVVRNSACSAVVALLSLGSGLVCVMLLNRGVSSNGIIRVGLAINFVVAVIGLVSGFRLVMHPESSSMPLFLVMSTLQCMVMIFYSGPTGGVYQQGCGKQQGLLGGVFTMFTSGGRVIGPFLGGSFLAKNPLPMTISVILSIFLCIIFHCAFYDRLQRTDQLARQTKASSEALARDADQEA